MLILVYDTETTGLPLFNEPSEDPRQPHIVQLAAQLFDTDTRRVVSRLDLVVRPDGWTIPAEVADLHGITQARAEAVGVPEDVAVSLLTSLWKVAAVRVGHNESFDARIVRIALKRFEKLGVCPNAWKAGAAECTADLSTDLCRLPATAKMVAAGRGKQFKRPTLAEAYSHFCNGELAGAHSAGGDVEGCLMVYRVIKGLA